MSPFDVVLSQAPKIDSMLDAELWASSVLGGFHWAALTSDDDPGEILDLAVDELLEKIEDNPGPAAMATARAFSLVAGSEQRYDFAELAESLAADGVADPVWFAGYEMREPRAAYSAADAARDVEVITLGYDDHVIGVVCDHVGLSGVVLAMVVPTDEIDAATLAGELAEESWSAPVPITSAAVKSRLTGPIDMFFDLGPADMGEDGAARDTVMSVALLTARVEDLPDELPDELPEPGPDPAEGFLASAQPDPELAQLWTVLVTDLALEYGREDHEFSLGFAEEVLFNRIVPGVRIEDADLAPLTEIVTGWARFTGIDRPDELPALLKEFVQTYRAYDDPSDRVVDLRRYLEDQSES
jgi:hypothetical protein